MNWCNIAGYANSNFAYLCEWVIKYFYQDHKEFTESRLFDISILVKKINAVDFTWVFISLDELN